MLLASFKKEKKTVKKIKMIRHGANLVKFYVKDLLDRRILENKGEFEPRFTPQNLEELIDETISIMKIQAEHKSIKILKNISS
jgi:signal transduction histidine kinase